VDEAGDDTSEPASVLAARQVAEVRDDPRRRLDLLRAAYASGAAPLPRYARAPLAFMEWQVRRGLLNPPDHERPGSPWWRAVNEQLLRDTCETRLRVLGHPGPTSSTAVAATLRFAQEPSPRTWYLAHNSTIVSSYLGQQDLAEHENRIERFFLNLVLVRVLYAHALVAAPRLALSWLAPIAGRLGDPRRDGTGLFLSVARVLPDEYPLDGELNTFTSAEHALGRLLDVGVIIPRLEALYAWSADQLQIPELQDLVRGGVPTYAWPAEDETPWHPPPTWTIRTARRMLPPRRRSTTAGE
jgi:hypothetical protein